MAIRPCKINGSDNVELVTSSDKIKKTWSFNNLEISENQSSSFLLLLGIAEIPFTLALLDLLYSNISEPDKLEFLALFPIPYLNFEGLIIFCTVEPIFLELEWLPHGVQIVFNVLCLMNLEPFIVVPAL